MVEKSSYNKFYMGASRPCFWEHKTGHPNYFVYWLLGQY